MHAMNHALRPSLILGIDPGLQKTGWGMIRVHHNTFHFIACGTIAPDVKLPMPKRLLALHEGIAQVVATHHPACAAIEETFVTANGSSTLKLGQARGALMLSLSIAGLPVSEYAALLVKKTITGVGRAEKSQVAMMVKTLLPQARAELDTHGADALDALAIAICHANHFSGARAA